VRTEQVPCKNATQYEIDNGKHLTFNDDSHCQPCKRVLDRFVLRRQQAEALERAAAREMIDEDAIEYATWNTGECATCGGAGILGERNDAHPSMWGLDCPNCFPDDDDEGETS
jgi:hypothetical protein